MTYLLIVSSNSSTALHKDNHIYKRMHILFLYYLSLTLPFSLHPPFQILSKKWSDCGKPTDLNSIVKFQMKDAIKVITKKKITGIKQQKKPTDRQFFLVHVTTNTSFLDWLCLDLSEKFSISILVLYMFCKCTYTKYMRECMAN